MKIKIYKNKTFNFIFTTRLVCDSKIPYQYDCKCKLEKYIKNCIIFKFCPVALLFYNTAELIQYCTPSGYIVWRTYVICAWMLQKSIAYLQQRKEGRLLVPNEVSDGKVYDDAITAVSCRISGILPNGCLHLCLNMQQIISFVRHDVLPVFIGDLQYRGYSMSFLGVV